MEIVEGSGTRESSNTVPELEAPPRPVVPNRSPCESMTSPASGFCPLTSLPLNDTSVVRTRLTGLNLKMAP